MSLTDTQRAELRRLADGARDTNPATWSIAFRSGRDEARRSLRDVLNAEPGDASQSAALAMDAGSCWHDECDEHGRGWWSLLDEVRRVLPSWPWLPNTPEPEGE